jgi:hypothetical protein
MTFLSARMICPTGRFDGMVQGYQAGGQTPLENLVVNVKANPGATVVAGATAGLAGTGVFLLVSSQYNKTTWPISRHWWEKRKAKKIRAALAKEQHTGPTGGAETQHKTG